jgi:putative ABC transport system ATP-binding protein
MIQTHGLVAAFVGGQPIHFPDVDVPQGGVLLVRGPSGSGKSTWLAVVAGLLAPHQGTLTVAGTPLVGSGVALDAWRARHVGFLPQKLHLSSALTVAQNLALVHWAAGLPPDPARISDTLAALGVGRPGPAAAACGFGRAGPTRGAGPCRAAGPKDTAGGRAYCQPG